ncbi:MAG: hypothetical protein IJY43_01520, partial [Clostridia bacterium]|nr:hypothetical protein [Clostridia bacterium]
NLVTTYMLPSYVAGETEDFGIALSNGNILVQYYVAADEMAEEYSFLMEPELDMYIGPPMKYNLYSFLINAESGKVKELDLDYIVMHAFFKQAGDDSWYYNEKIENVAYVIYIEDQRINFTPDAQKLVSLSNKGKVKGVIEPVDNMLGDLTQVATNRWTAANLAGQVFLLNEKGEVLGEVTKTTSATKTASFFVLNNKIYDWDLNVKVDLIDEKIEGECIIMDHSALFKNEDGEWKLYTNGELKTVIDKATADAGTRELEYISSSIYAIVDTATEGKTKYEFYNDAGALLIAIEDADIDVEQCLVCTAGSNNAVLIKGLSIPGEGETAKPVYYRVG